MKLCAYYMRHFGLKRLRAQSTDWFDGQLVIAKELGIHWQDLYKRTTDLNALFAEAAKRAQ